MSIGDCQMLQNTYFCLATVIKKAMIDLEQIQTVPFFEGMDDSEIKRLLQEVKYELVVYEKGSLVLDEGDPKEEAYFIYEGRVSTFFKGVGGRGVKINILRSPVAIAQDTLFADKDNSYSVSAVAVDCVKIVKIRIEELIRVLQDNPLLMKNYLSFVANKHLQMFSRMRMLLIKTIPQKLAFLVLDLAGDKLDVVKLPMSQTELADYLAVTRPSLARGLRQLSEMKVISYKTRTIQILDKKKLFELLYP